MWNFRKQNFAISLLCFYAHAWRFIATGNYFWAMWLSYPKDLISKNCSSLSKHGEVWHTALQTLGSERRNVAGTHIYGKHTTSYQHKINFCIVKQPYFPLSLGVMICTLNSECIKPALSPCSITIHKYTENSKKYKECKIVCVSISSIHLMHKLRS